MGIQSDEGVPEVKVALGYDRGGVVFLNEGAAGTCQLRQLIAVLDNPREFVVDIALDEG